MSNLKFNKTNPKSFLKRLYDTEDKKRLLSNFSSLAMLQGANYILPLITFPYLVRVLGVEKYGLLAFASATIAYFNIVTDYGFNLTATREVSIYRDNKEKLIEIFSSVMIIKFILMIVSFLLLLILVFSFDKFKTHYEVFLLTFGMVIGQVLFPQWFFQGIERMKYITFLNILSKVIFTIAIFIFIHKQSDYWKVPLINSLGFISAGIVSLWIIKRDFQMKFKLQKITTLKAYLIDGWRIFISVAGINMYKKNSILILGIFANNTIVGYFSIAKKLMDIINSVASVISQSIYPYTMKNINKTTISNFLKKIGTGIASYTLILGIIFFVLSNFMTIILTKHEYYQLSISIKMLAFVPFIIGINVPAVHILLGNKQDKLFSKAVIYGGLLDILLNFLLVPHFSYIGSCFSIIITETYVTLMLYFYVYKIYHGKKGGG